MKHILLVAAAAAVFVTPAAAAIIVDGALDGDYGAAKSSVAFNPAAPNSNFSTPTNESDQIAYDIYLSTDYTNVFGLVRATSNGTNAPAGTFANLYFDLDPSNGNGSDLGFEISANSQNSFVPGMAGSQSLSFPAVASVDGLTLEFSIPVSYFTTPIAGLNYYAGQEFVSAANPDLVLRLSQSFGYSVAGGASYGADRLGRLTLFAADEVPEPAMLGLFGLGAIGLGLSRRRRG